MATHSKKKNKYFIWAIPIFLFVAIAAIYGGYEWWKNRRSRFVRYPAFGISIPENFLIHGIDVSKYQQNISWESVKGMKVRNVQLGFVFIKATEGIGNTDPQFKRNWKKSKEAGVLRGAYHFFIGSKDGRLQAENFIKRVELETGDLPPVLDVEQLNGANPLQVRKEIKKWLAIVENNYGVKP